MIAAVLAIAMGADGPDLAYVARYYSATRATGLRIYVANWDGSHARPITTQNRTEIERVVWQDRETVLYSIPKGETVEVHAVDIATLRDRILGTLETGALTGGFPPDPPGFPSLAINLPNYAGRPAPRPAFTMREIEAGSQMFGDSVFQSTEDRTLTWSVGTKRKTFDPDWIYTRVLQVAGQTTQYLYGYMHDSTTGSRSRLLALEPEVFTIREILTNAHTFDWWPGRSRVAWTEPRGLAPAGNGKSYWTAGLWVRDGDAKPRRIVSGLVYVWDVAVRPSP